MRVSLADSCTRIAAHNREPEENHTHVTTPTVVRTRWVSRPATPQLAPSSAKQKTGNLTRDARVVVLHVDRYVRKQIGKKVRLRLTPEVRFLLDDSYIRGTRVSRSRCRLHALTHIQLPAPCIWTLSAPPWTNHTANAHASQPYQPCPPTQWRRFRSRHLLRPDCAPSLHKPPPAPSTP